MGISRKFREYTGFEWDEHNSEKIWLQHDIIPSECEQAYFNKPFIVSYDQRHSQTEDRYFALGHTDTRRLLFIVFTIRNNLIRVTSARDMTTKEQSIYASRKK